MTGRALVTGGAGFIGSHLVDALVAEGWGVTVFDDLSTGSKDNLAQATRAGDVRFVEGNVVDPMAVASAIEGCGTVFHLAVQCVRRSLARPLDNHAVNATGTITVLEASRRSGVERFVYCSSSEVYGNTSAGRLNEDTTVCRPTTIYGAAKLAGELYTHAYRATYGLNTMVLRPFNAYGPRAHVVGDLAEVVPRFIIRVLCGLPPIFFGDGRNTRDFTYVTEVAQGLLLAASRDNAVGRTINIARGAPITVAQVAETICCICQQPDMIPTQGPVRPGDVLHLRADTALASHLLGYQPKIAFEEGIERTIGWFTRTHPDPTVVLEDEVRNWEMPR